MGMDYDDEEPPEAFLGHGKTLLSLFGSSFLDLAYAGLSPGVTWEAAFLRYRDLDGSI